MNGLGRWQYRFLLHLFPLLLSIRGRYNFCHLARYGRHGERTYRDHYAKDFDWLDFNARLVERYLSPHRIVTLDPCYLTKSGKHSDGVGYFWSGAASRTQWGQEFCGLAAVDTSDKTALHLLAVQTLDPEWESPLDYYTSIVTINAEELARISDYLVVDAYFAKAPFVEAVRRASLHLNTRLRSDQVLRYSYLGPRRKGPGAPRQYDGRVDVHNLRPDVFSLCAVADDGVSWRAYEAVVHVKAWKRWARVVIIQRYDAAGKVCGHTTLASTDTAQPGADLVLNYTCRFQHEFLYRDAKQELGLEDCQAYGWPKIDFHLNASLTTVSLAKAAHCLTPGRPHDEPFSIADVKTEYVNRGYVAA